MGRRAVASADAAGVRRLVAEALGVAGEADPRPSRVAAAEAYARHDPALRLPATGHDGWDADPLLLGTPGGTVDLRTGVLRPASPADRITRSTVVTPAEVSAEGAADCPLWHHFLADATGGDPATLRWLHRFCGYGLTGDTGEHALLFLLGGGGEGGVGKSVFANTLRGLLGTYAAVAAPDLLLAGAERRAGKAHSAEIAALAGARLVTASETEEGRVWAEGRLKLLTGGDPVTARFLGRDPFTFTPRFKLVVTGNCMPVLRSADAALRRRLHVLPFAAQPAVPDRTLAAKLRAEGPAILRWMVDGCLMWQGREGHGGDGQGAGSQFGPSGALDNEPGGVPDDAPAGGLMPPAAVLAATDGYFAGQDLVGLFLAEWAERAPQCAETAADLYAAWCAYARASGEPPGSQRQFAVRLERHFAAWGLTRERTPHVRLYRGLRLIRPGERAAELHKARGGKG